MIVKYSVFFEFPALRGDWIEEDFVETLAKKLNSSRTYASREEAFERATNTLAAYRDSYPEELSDRVTIVVRSSPV